MKILEMTYKVYTCLLFGLHPKIDLKDYSLILQQKIVNPHRSHQNTHLYIQIKFCESTPMITYVAVL